MTPFGKALSRELGRNTDRGRALEGVFWDATQPLTIHLYRELWHPVARSTMELRGFVAAPRRSR